MVKRGGPPGLASGPCHFPQFVYRVPVACRRPTLSIFSRTLLVSLARGIHSGNGDNWPAGTMKPVRSTSNCIQRLSARFVGTHDKNVTCSRERSSLFLSVGDCWLSLRRFQLPSSPLPPRRSRSGEDSTFFNTLRQLRGNLRRRFENHVPTLNVCLDVCESQLLEGLPKLVHLDDLVPAQIDAPKQGYVGGRRAGRDFHFVPDQQSSAAVAHVWRTSRPSCPSLCSTGETPVLHECGRQAAPRTGRPRDSRRDAGATV